MSLYAIDTKQYSSDILPNCARDVEDKLFLESIVKGTKRFNTILNNNIEGADFYSGLSLWAVGTYLINDRVIYLNDGGVYECIVDSTTDIPSITTSWRKVSESFIGTDESSNFNGQKQVLEYALNRRFFGFYYNAPANSEIYIDITTTIPNIFYCGDGVGNSSGSYDGVGYQGAPDGFTVGLYSNFTIYLPLALSVSLGVDYEKIIRIFVSKYITAGVYYTVTTY